VQPYRVGAAFITLGKNSSSKRGEAATSRTTTSRRLGTTYTRRCPAPKAATRSVGAAETLNMGWMPAGAWC
jgi:hypothetical protein